MFASSLVFIQRRSVSTLKRASPSTCRRGDPSALVPDSCVQMHMSVQISTAVGCTRRAPWTSARRRGAARAACSSAAASSLRPGNSASGQDCESVTLRQRWASQGGCSPRLLQYRQPSWLSLPPSSGLAPQYIYIYIYIYIYREREMYIYIYIYIIRVTLIEPPFKQLRLP